MKKLIANLKSMLNAKPSPGVVLNTISDLKLQELSARYKHDSEALWIGAYIADLFITEAIKTGKIAQHIPMALDYAKKVIAENHIPSDKAEIILELIATHHGGDQKHIESKLFKNADCFKFLDPKGVFHIFGAKYEIHDEAHFHEAIQYAMFKLEEKYALVDIDEQTKKEATELYTMWKAIFARLPYKTETPEIYK